MNSKINLMIMIVSNKNDFLQEIEDNFNKLKADLNSNLNFDFTISRSGNEAFFKALESKYSLIIIDIDMKDMNGIESICFIKREKLNQSTPVIFIEDTFNDQSKYLEKYLELKKTESVDLIFRPLSWVALFAKIKDVLQIVNSANSVTKTISIEGVTILLVEDDPVAQKVLSNCLTEENAKVIVADDGILALEIFQNQNQNQNIDIILMDVRIPGMNGHEITKEIRKSHHGKTIPIIGITGNAFEEDRNACIDAGMDEVLVKPIDFDLLISTIAKYVVIKKS
ncbi:MAG: response regulator [Oligoflexia bacterium]|nr:response regulator [Oligoflexia bacterium]